MKKYLVGGAVRNLLLNIPIKDKDFVVIGTTPEQMLALGFKQIAKAFPVFLEPIKKEEYALARKDIKIGHGYKGFLLEYDISITLEEDLYRRDITINAIALDDQGHFYDPYKGCADIKNCIIRHVSYAFVDDPLRVLRVARFYASLYNKGFQVALSTKQLMTTVIGSGELQYLSGERLLMEINKALDTVRPDLFFLLLKELGTFKAILLPLDKLQHKAYEDLLLALKCTKNKDILFFVILMDLDITDILKLLQDIRMPKRNSQLILELKKYYIFSQSWYEQDSTAISKFIKDIFRIKGGEADFLNTLLIIYKCFSIKTDSIDKLKLLLKAIKHNSSTHFTNTNERINKETEIIKSFLEI